MTRSKLNPDLVEFDPKIERTLRLIRTTRRRLFDPSFVKDSLGVLADHCTYNSPTYVSNPKVDSSSNSEFDFVASTLVSNNSAFPENMANTHDRTLKELVAPDVN